VTYEDMQEAVGRERPDGRRELPVAAVIAVEDHEGRVLYSDVHFTTHPVLGDMQETAKKRGWTLVGMSAAIAAYACSLGHLSYRRSCR
jgi:hypothetical protein